MIARILLIGLLLFTYDVMAEVREIELKEGSGHQSVAPSDLMSMQQQLLNNAEIMELVKALQHDPQIQAILNDPQLLQSIAAGDVQALMNNAQFKALMDNPKIQEISRKVQP